MLCWSAEVAQECAGPQLQYHARVWVSWLEPPCTAKHLHASNLLLPWSSVACLPCCLPARCLPPPRYFVLVPADDSVSLRAAGEAFVVDPYSQGMLLSASEVR
jgi:hypothetical protein